MVCYEKSPFDFMSNCISASGAMFHSKLLEYWRVSALPSYMGVLGPNTPDMFSVVG